jgi:hypothetical protein
MMSSADPDTNVLITRFLSPESVGEVHDFIPRPGPRTLKLPGRLSWHVGLP